MSIDFGNTELTELTPRIAVVGVGGAGCNAVNNMIAAQLQGVDFVVANTDAQALTNARADNRIQLGVEITQGLGAGAQPKIGEAAAEEALERIDEMLAGCHMAFVTAGMGGGTGTGAAPVIARRAREKGILTVGVVTKPFQFEGGRRMKIAESGIKELAENVDTLIIIPNQNLFRVANERTTFADAFNMADEVLHSGVRGITDLMVMPGLINLDFADVRTVMSEMGKAMMGTGEAEGEARAADAAAAAISNPLLEEASLRGAKGVIINVTGGMDMTLFEVDEAVNMVRDQVDEDALIVFGSAFNQDLEGKLRVSVVATGIEGTGGAGLPIPEPVREVVAEPQSDVDDDSAAAAEQSETDAEMQDEQPVEAALAAIHDEMTAEVGVVETAEDAEDAVTENYEDARADDEGADDLSLQTFDAGQSVSHEQSAEPVQNTVEEDLEQRAIAAQGEDSFVADAPMMPKESLALPRQAEPEQDTVYRTEPAQPAAPQVQEREPEAAPQKKSLFQLMTSGLRSQEPDDTATVSPPPASNDAGGQDAKDVAKSSDTAGALGGVTQEDRPAPKADTEQLEIPSFLRRQQN